MIQIEQPQSAATSEFDLAFTAALLRTAAAGGMAPHDVERVWGRALPATWTVHDSCDVANAIGVDLCALVIEAQTAKIALVAA